MNNKAKRKDFLVFFMKTEIIKGIYINVTIDNKKTYMSTFNPLLKEPFHFEVDAFPDVGGLFTNVELLEDGTVSMNFKENKIVLTRNKPIIIEDEISVWDRDRREDIPHKVRFELHLKYQEVEIDKHNLSLVAIEKADGEACIPGNKTRKIPVKEGEIISASLLKDEQLRLQIKKVDGLNITIEALNPVRRDVYPCDFVKTIIINQFQFLNLYSEGGYNTRYDYESWHWGMQIKLDIKGAVQFKGEWKK